MSNDPPLVEGDSDGRLILASMVLSRIVAMSPGLLTGLLLIDIGLAFEYSVGVIGQIRTFSSSVAVVFALFMGALSVRFRHKSLLMTGLLFFSLSALGCFLAPNFNTMLIAFSISGLGVAMVMPMTATLVAEHFPLQRRASAVGWLTAGISSSYLLGAPIIGFISYMGGWRLAFLGYVLPVSILSLLLTAVSLPFSSHDHQTMMSEGNYLEGFKSVLLNRSAAACLLGSALSGAAWQAIILYGTSFLRQRFLISTGFTSIYVMGLAVCSTIGGLVCGRFVNRFGKRPLTVIAVFISGISTISFTNLPNLWSSIALAFLGSFFFGTMVTASVSLTLEQVPRFRGTMMSLNSAGWNLGDALGAGVGGLMLLLYDYEFLGLSLGALGIAAAMIFLFLTIDPTRTKS